MIDGPLMDTISAGLDINLNYNNSKFLKLVKNSREQEESNLKKPEESNLKKREENNSKEKKEISNRR